MPLTIIESGGERVELTPEQSLILLDALRDPDPRVSACVNCHSAVLASEPFGLVLDELGIDGAIDGEVVREIIELVENTESVHVYIWEANECVHQLWKDPLAYEWSEVTGEKRFRS